MLSREAFKAAGDPSRYPEQIREGLRPWQPKKFYYPAVVGPGGGRGAERAAPLPERHSPTRCLKNGRRRYRPVSMRCSAARTPRSGSEERSMHKSQAMAQLLSLPAGAGAATLSADGRVRRRAPPAEEASLFDGIDTTIPGLARFAKASLRKTLVAGLRAIADQVAEAQKQFDLSGPYAAAPALVAGLNAVRALRSSWRAWASARMRASTSISGLKTKEDEFSEAAVLAHGLRLEVLADDGVVVPSEPVRVSVMIGDRARRSTATISAVTLKGFDGTGGMRHRRRCRAETCIAAKRR